MIGRMYVPRKMVYDEDRLGYDFMLKYKSNFGLIEFFNLSAFVVNREDVNILLLTVSDITADFRYIKKRKFNCLTDNLVKYQKPESTDKLESLLSKVAQDTRLKNPDIVEIDDIPCKIYRPTNISYDKSAKFTLPIMCEDRTDNVSIELAPRIYEENGEIIEIMAMGIKSNKYPVLIVEE